MLCAEIDTLHTRLRFTKNPLENMLALIGEKPGLAGLSAAKWWSHPLTTGDLT